MQENTTMQFQKILVPLGSLALVLFSYRQYGWPGVAASSGVLMMWLLLHFTRMLQVLKRAAQQPIGYVGSAVMLNAKLRKGASLLHVVAMTKSLGEQLSEKGVQPERFRWTDGSQSNVTCEFVGGKLMSWTLLRPESSN
jgi:hypothetical protein